jgi:hypothetical protein
MAVNCALRAFAVILGFVSEVIDAIEIPKLRTNGIQQRFDEKV